nr:MAG TPA: hypothetical protein [Inoviridae sp.]
MRDNTDIEPNKKATKSSPKKPTKPQLMAPIITSTRTI